MVLGAGDSRLGLGRLLVARGWLPGVGWSGRPFLRAPATATAWRAASRASRCRWRRAGLRSSHWPWRTRSATCCCRRPVTRRAGSCDRRGTATTSVMPFSRPADVHVRAIESSSKEGRRLPVRSALDGSEVASSRSNFLIARVPNLHLNFAPGAVSFLVRGHIADRVLRADLGDDLLVHAVELLHRCGEERAAAGRIGNLLEDRPLLVPR